MFRTESEPIPYKVKYALVAHEKGTDYYILASNNGNLMACDQELLNSLRVSESLIFFDVIFENIVRQQDEYERTGIIHPGTATEHTIKEIRSLLSEALLLLGLPPKENVEFFSLPKNIVENLYWIPRKIKT